MAPGGHHDDDAPTPASASSAPPPKVPSEKELARKIRKRELDRRAQRQARERTRNRIAELEALVKELRKDDSTRLSACMEQLAAVTRERDRLLDAFKSIDQTIRNHVLPPSRPSPPGTGTGTGTGTRTTAAAAAAAAAKLPSPAPPPRSLPDPRDVIRDPMLTGLLAHSYTPSSSSVFDAHAYNGGGQGLVGSVPNGLSSTSLHASSVDAPSSMSDSQDFMKPTTPCACETVRTPAGSSPPKVNVWRAVNQVLAKRCRISRRAHAAEDADDEDIPVRAILEGWEAAARPRPLSRLWKKLRRVDELCFQVCPPAERLAILRMMHLLLQYHSDPTPDRHAKMPTWFLKRPGVRERFVFGQHHYCNNQFWDLFSPNLHLLWPFEFRDAYKKSVVTGRYQISPMFEQRIADINSWTMGGDFFVRFPELAADIPCFQSVLRSLSPPPPPPPPLLASPVPQQASLSRLKERGERLLRGEQHAAAGEDQSTQEGMDCTHAMQSFPPGLYSMAPPGFMDEFIPQSFDANGAGSYEPMSGYF
ncbi:hypothetical protein CSHISOI_08823 [Colletotrichum shisoi]|uniref:BZIP transcription factor n=1 Tax=Colletotrichum shisoi TaxID=2078593 RepID=A0A5Q4BIN3_9PEZI|nr:hypothetical protein CSHISOI_08823 [Colletotrichum shisoi]